jgi:diguanylate cyclase (GGDEF)-like protein
MKVIFQYLNHDRKLILILFLSCTGAIFLAGFSVLNIYVKNYPLASLLLLSLILGLSNIIYLLKAKCKEKASINLAGVIYLLNIGLLISGGREGTGIFWTYPIMTISIAILTSKQGIWFCLSFLVSACLVFLFSREVSWIADYSYYISTRYLFSILALCSICLGLIKIQEALHYQLEIKTVTDELTGLFNRGVIKNYKQKAINNKHGEMNSLMLIDIDFFKDINDELGHSVGDVVLILISKILSSSLGENDLAIRWGGEEFLLILTNCTDSAAAEKAEMLRLSVLTNKDIIKLLGRELTISIGLATTKDVVNINDAVKLADENLYRAKNNGRNQVVA